jgi:hypothetical protein
MTRHALLTLALASLAACDSTEGPTTPGSLSDMPPLAASAVRTPSTIFIDGFVDEEAGLTLTAGISAEQLTVLCGGGEPALDPGVERIGTRPDGSVHWKFQAKELSVLVWNEANADICSPPFATGTANFHFNDNDVTVSHNRTNSFKFDLSGTVRSVQTGQLYGVNAKFHATISKDDEFVLKSWEIDLTPK